VRDKVPDRQRELNRFFWNMYHRPPMSRKMKFSLGVVGIALLGFAIGFEHLVRVSVLLFQLAIVGAIGFCMGSEHGELKGAVAERKRMLAEGYSLGNQEVSETRDDVKPLQACRWCGHIINGED